MKKHRWMLLLLWKKQGKRWRFIFRQMTGSNCPWFRSGNRKNYERTSTICPSDRLCWFFLVHESCFSNNTSVRHSFRHCFGNSTKIAKCQMKKITLYRFSVLVTFARLSLWRAIWQRQRATVWASERRVGAGAGTERRRRGVENEAGQKNFILIILAFLLFPCYNAKCIW